MKKLFRWIKEKKTSLLVPLCLLTVLASLLSGGIVTMARYITEKRSHQVVTAEPFYFYSDKLVSDGSRTCQAEALADGQNARITFQLRNFVDGKRRTNVAMNYQWQIKDGEGTVITPTEVTVDGVLQAISSEALFTGSFAGNNSSGVTKTITAVVGLEALPVTVQAKATSPYEKSLSAVFNLEAEETSFSYEVENNTEAGAVVMTFIGTGDAVTISWPSVLVPDRTNPLLSGATLDNGEYSVTVTPSLGVRYALTFLPMTSGNYSTSTFTVTVGS